MPSDLINGRVYAWVTDVELFIDAERMKKHWENLGYDAIIDHPCNDIEDQMKDGDPLCPYGIWAAIKDAN